MRFVILVAVPEPGALHGEIMTAQRFKRNMAEMTIFQQFLPKRGIVLPKPDHNRFIHCVTWSRTSPPAINRRATAQRPMNGDQAGFMGYRYGARRSMVENRECTHILRSNLDGETGESTVVTKEA